MTIEIVDFPINSMVIFHSYVNVYQRVIGLTLLTLVHLCAQTCNPFTLLVEKIHPFVRCFDQQYFPLAMVIGDCPAMFADRRV